MAHAATRARAGGWLRVLGVTDRGGLTLSPGPGRLVLVLVLRFRGHGGGGGVGEHVRDIGVLLEGWSKLTSKQGSGCGRLGWRWQRLDVRFRARPRHRCKIRYRRQSCKIDGGSGGHRCSSNGGNGGHDERRMRERCG